MTFAGVFLFPVIIKPSRFNDVWDIFVIAEFIKILLKRNL